MAIISDLKFTRHYLIGQSCLEFRTQYHLVCMLAGTKQTHHSLHTITVCVTTTQAVKIPCRHHKGPYTCEMVHHEHIR